MKRLWTWMRCVADTAASGFTVLNHFPPSRPPLPSRYPSAEAWESAMEEGMGDLDELFGELRGAHPDLYEKELKRLHYLVTYRLAVLKG